MILIDGYTIEQFPNQNKIIIGLPQTMKTCTNTTEPVSERREILCEDELSAILMLAKTYLEMYNVKAFKGAEMINYECPYLIKRENHVPMCRFYGRPCESVDCDEKELKEQK